MSLHRSLQVVIFPSTRRIRSHPNQMYASARKRKRHAAKKLKLKEEARALNIHPTALTNQRFVECQLRIERQQLETARKAREAMEQLSRTGWRSYY